ncbi:unnamed protein product [Didymodactylos carnosus]|uniref:Uncharacterized protein n=1 Tax=Didymodactylos carnosus TaxID=1234261 RepID=A0A8S2DK95_9BILA|nr:unnamed protein product [Didymodactylos carnosus]CAF3757658.1 unnamed protein product [Didymodactylos carnosus]
MAWLQNSDPSSKFYYSSDFRRNCPSSLSFACADDVARHQFDCQLAAAAARYSRGPYYSDSTTNQYARNLASRDNFYYYGSSTSNYGHDRTSVNKVLQSAYSGNRAVLTPHEAAHIRAGGQWLADHKRDFSRGFINSAASNLYANVYDQNGHKVVDGRTLRY